MKVICIDNENAKRDLTMGRVYEVLRRKVDLTEEFYLINNDKNEECSYFKNRFRTVKETEKGDENMKFKVGDKIEVTNNRGNEYFYNVEDKGTVVRVFTAHHYADVKFDIPKQGDGIWGVGEKDMKKQPIEFAFEEVTARDENNKTYECTETGYNLQTIKKLDNGNIRLYFKNHDDDYSSNLEYITVNMKDAKFKLQQPKKRITIYKIEHKKDGKKYDFISSQLLQVYNFVVCDTTQGKSYGRVVGSEEKDLTEEEIKQYKECWRA